jgi:hypothetical protein
MCFAALRETRLATFFFFRRTEPTYALQQSTPKPSF